VAAVALAGVAGFLVAGVASGRVDWAQLLTGAVWDPARGRFGGAAMIWGTLAVSAVALALAAPVGWGAAVAIAEVAPGRWRRGLRATTEVLAVVPSIVYGLVGIVYLRPAVSRLAGVPGGDSLLAAACVLAVMVLPTIVAVSVDALVAVPGSYREAAAASGLTRSEVVRAAVLPHARRGLVAAALLGLARALGETIAVFLLVGRADGRLPGSVAEGLRALVRPGQTLTTKLNGPESVLAGTSGDHWAALCALGLVLLGGVGLLTAAGRRSLSRGSRQARPTRQRLPRGAADRAWRGLWVAALAVPLALVALLVVAVVARGGRALSPGFWWTAAVGSAGGGVRDQIAGTLTLVAGTAAVAAPVGLALGLAMAEYATSAAARWLRSLALTLAGLPSILLGLFGYWLFSTTFGWGKSWLAGCLVLAVVAVPPVAVAVAAAAGSLPALRREAALAAGLRREQLVRSVVVPHALPGLLTGLLLGLARAAGETAPILFTATVFSGAGAWPGGVVDAPVAALPTHIFTLAQDAADAEALRAAWGSAVVLMAVAGLLVLAAGAARRRMEAARA
jgi:phosphate transport system permease protein